MYEIKLEEFIDWLNSKDEDAYIGTCGDNARCPLAHFLGDRYLVAFQVGHLTYSYLKNGIKQYENLPGWALNFVDKIDLLGERKFKSGGIRKVYKNETIWILNNVVNQWETNKI